MKLNYYFKHDAPAFVNQKLTRLLLEEGAKGYGVYWILLEMLRMQSNFQLSVTMMRTVARHAHVRLNFVDHVVRDYGLFVCENNVFFSPGLDKRMATFLSKRGKYTEKFIEKFNANMLINNGALDTNARKEEQSIEKYSINSLSNECVRQVLSMDESIALLPTEELWCEDMARRSGRGVGFVQQLPGLLLEFACFLRLRGEEHTVCGLSDAKRRFLYWMLSADGQTALKNCGKQVAEKDLYRYETLVNGQRTYLGRPIPEGAPPRPTQTAAWNEGTGTWML